MSAPTPQGEQVQYDFTDFADYYNALECEPDADADTIKKSYRKLVHMRGTSEQALRPRLVVTHFLSIMVDWHPDKRPESPSQTGKKMFQLINDAWTCLQDDAKRQEYTLLWREYQRQKLMPFERAELARKEGNEFYKKGQIAAKENNIPQALTMYQAAIEKYSEGIRESENDHRLYSNRALCYAVLRDWARAKKDAQRVVEIRSNFMKGWFTLVRSYMMENNIGEAEQQLQKGLRFCDNHADLLKLQDEIQQRKQEEQEQSTTAAGGTSSSRPTGMQEREELAGTTNTTATQNPLNASSSTRPISYRDVTPSRTPPTPLIQSRLGGSRGLSGTGVPHWAVGQELDQTGNFGQGTGNFGRPGEQFDNTANFGRSIGYARTPPKGNSPRYPPGMQAPPRYATPPRMMNQSGGLSGMSGGLNSSMGSSRGPIDYGTANPLNQTYKNYNRSSIVLLRKNDVILTNDFILRSCYTARRTRTLSFKILSYYFGKNTNHNQARTIVADHRWCSAVCVSPFRKSNAPQAPRSNCRRASAAGACTLIARTSKAKIAIAPASEGVAAITGANRVLVQLGRACCSKVLIDEKAWHLRTPIDVTGRNVCDYGSSSPSVPAAIGPSRTLHSVLNLICFAER
ncbi:unnamed protein product [Amoebophrya sp. A120]|nr:unnamed protein product [Amoebophrya sp. A120]|eukprot:GSA120T00001947001.1